MYMRMIAGCAAALALAACSGGGDAGGDGWAGTMTDSAGVTIVANEGAQMWSADGGWKVEEVLRIGTPEGAAEYQFGQISGIGTASDGSILVMDQQGQELKVFGPDGAWVRTIGEAGNGPGQFGPQAGPVLVGRGDTVLVPDLGNQRVNLLTPGGEILGSFRLGLEQGIPVRWDMTTDDSPVTQLRALNLPNQAGPADTMDAIVTRAYDGTIRDTLVRVPAGKTFSFGSGQPVFRFFSPEPIWTMTGDGGIVLGVNNAYTFRVFGADGQLSRIVRMPFEQQAVTEEDRTLFVETLERLWGQAGVPAEGISMLKQGISFEDKFPAYAQALAGPAGSLWVQRIKRPSDLTPEEKAAFNPLQNIGSADWDVFDAEGRYLGVVTLPVHFQPIGFEADRIFGVWRDDLDVQYVMVLRVLGLS